MPMTVTHNATPPATETRGRHYLYVPILKGKPGEFDALRHSDALVLARTRPLFEVVPSEHGRDRDVELFADRLGSAWAQAPQAGVATIDCGALNQTSRVRGSMDSAILWMARMLYDKGVPARPVVRPRDSVAVITEAAAAMRLHGRGVCLRLGDETADPDVATAAARLEPLLRELEAAVDDVHLLIDLWAVTSLRDVNRALPVAEAVTRWAASVGTWASITVASGAFPDSISDLPVNTATNLPRYDAQLWRQLSETPGIPYVPDFGDYAINAPAMPLAVPRGPIPNLRYTFGADWRVFREQRRRPGNQSFFTLCGRVVADAAWPREGTAHCWGDDQIERCSRSAGSPGAASQWRAYGTSHHLATVTRRLASRRVP
jgi:hypothetical protein